VHLINKHQALSEGEILEKKQADSVINHACSDMHPSVISLYSSNSLSEPELLLERKEKKREASEPMKLVV